MALVLMLSGSSQVIDMLASQQDTLSTLQEANGMRQCVSHASESIRPLDGYFTPPPRDSDAAAAQESILMMPGTTLQEPTGFKIRDRYAVLAS